LVIYGDLAKDASTEERQIAATAMRRVGGGLKSRHVAGYPWVKWCMVYFPLLRWDIHSAGDLLISLARTTEFGGFSHVSISPPAALIRLCLRLPIPEQPPMMRALTENMMQPGAAEFI
jgi:hypothetical protein